MDHEFPTIDPAALPEQPPAPPPPPPPSSEPGFKELVVHFLAGFGLQVSLGFLLGVAIVVGSKVLGWWEGDFTEIFMIAVIPITIIANIFSFFLSLYFGAWQFGRKFANSPGSFPLGDAPMRRPTAEGVGLALLAVLAAGLYFGWDAKPEGLMTDLAEKYLVSAGGLAVFATLALSAAFFEEFYFRGFLWGIIERRWSSTVALTVSSLTFASIHLGQLGEAWPMLVFIGLMGLRCGMWRRETGSLLPGLALHFGYNGVLVLLQAGAMLADVLGLIGEV